jgi:diadenosine tetraphosphate (Ap4A) HIT family hydrolase
MSNCVFCDRSTFEERIISETDEYYVIATLGQITDGYVLLFPKKHVPCMGALPQEDTHIMFGTAFRVWQALSAEYARGSDPREFLVTAFEHGIVGQSVKHAHMHLVPQVVDMTDRIRNDFPDYEIEELDDASELNWRYTDWPRPYLFWTRHDGAPMVCWDPPAPAQYLRIVLADMLGHPERANWRTMDQKLDKKLWSETVRRLKPHF